MDKHQWERKQDIPQHDWVNYLVWTKTKSSVTLVISLEQTTPPRPQAKKWENVNSYALLFQQVMATPGNTGLNTWNTTITPTIILNW